MSRVMRPEMHLGGRRPSSVEEQLVDRLTKRGFYWSDEAPGDRDDGATGVWDGLARKDAVYYAVRASSEAREEAKSRETIRILCQHLKPGSMLDLGCGYGRIAKYLLPATDRVADYIGLDQSEEMLSLFFNRYRSRPEEQNSPLTLIKSDITEIPLDDNSLDNVVTSAVYLHNHKQAIAGSIAEVFRVLKPGGKFFTFSSFPNRFSLNGVQGACYLGLLRCVGRDKANGPIRYFSRSETEMLTQKFSKATILEHDFAVLPKSLLILPPALDSAYRALVFEPSQSLLRHLFSPKLQKRFCAHFDVIAEK